MRNKNKKKKLRSSFEEDVRNLLTENNVNFKYEAVKVSYTVEAVYTPDFKIGTILVETKGYFSATDRKKMKAVKSCNPSLDIRIWFQRDNFLTKSKKKTYSDWAKQHGFLCHVGPLFPFHWFT